jgi:hypothetical protein
MPDPDDEGTTWGEGGTNSLLHNFKCNETFSVTNMVKRNTWNILLQWKSWNSACCLTFIMTFCVTMQLSVQLLAAEILSPAFTLHYMLTSAASTVGVMEKTEPETQSTF